MTTKNETIVVIGNGMVGHRFIERLLDYDLDKRYRIVTYCEESRTAYDRVGLTSFFVHRDAEKLMLARRGWYESAGVEVHLGDRVTSIDHKRGVVISQKGVATRYDKVIFATGSIPFVPKIPGVNNRGVFLYRTINDLEKIIEYAKGCKSCAVIGGGLLGLEAAKASFDLGLITHIFQVSNRLLQRQIDDGGSRILVKKIESMGMQVHLNKNTTQVIGENCAEGLKFQDGSRLEVDMVIISAGIVPRDDLAKDSGIAVGERGGICIDDHLRTSVPGFYAIGECALHNGFAYGLVAPGWEMADIAAANLCGANRTFTGADLSTKLKLNGVDVASFGQYELGPEQAQPLAFEDPFSGLYKKLFFSHDGKRLLGGILVGDASDYGMLSVLAKTGAPFPCTPSQLLGMGGSDLSNALGGVAAISDDAQVCSCNNVTKRDICKAIGDKTLTSLGDVKKCTKAGTGCGGCLPLVTDIFKSEMAKAGVAINNHLCEHFAFSRAELFDIIKIKEIKTFSALIKSHGTGIGCEVCKPAVASIFASLWNDCIVDRAFESLQDSNDRFLANIQRGGTYSVVPRVPGGEITPEKLIVIGEVAKKYKLYTKITGGQRIDLFGAEVHQLPDIWSELVDAGFESGHAYGKALRTVKSCVGSTWCRFGVQDSVGFAIRVEERYRGIRAPHKIKMAVSGCVRECAEAQSKDFGLIATESGYNLYVCGNGGTKPRHADLFATDLDETTALRYIDRVMMYYIFTAEKLTRTATWLETLDGGLEQLKAVVIDDKLGICDELERRMQHLVDTYRCEWAEVVNDPEKQKRFRQFVNCGDNESTIEFIPQRDQSRPADWPKGGVQLVQLTSTQSSADSNLENLSQSSSEDTASKIEMELVSQVDWVNVGVVDDFPNDGGATIKYGKVQIAVYNVTSRNEWYACQNMCPHMNAFVLSRGIVGDAAGEPKVACPLHKKPFSLKSGKCLSGEDYELKVFPVRIVGGEVQLLLPPIQYLDTLLATDKHRISGRRSQQLPENCNSCSAN
ncbi:MAG: nitrite reductase large subunit NirB [Pirellulaceae bacterium]|nr:nitrite reductase large subunit NirB [Pirellulaceae bacterium]